MVATGPESDRIEWNWFSGPVCAQRTSWIHFYLLSSFFQLADGNGSVNQVSGRRQLWNYAGTAVNNKKRKLHNRRTTRRGGGGGGGGGGGSRKRSAAFWVQELLLSATNFIQVALAERVTSFFYIHQRLNWSTNFCWGFFVFFFFGFVVRDSVGSSLVKDKQIKRTEQQQQTEDTGENDEEFHPSRISSAPPGGRHW